MSDGQRPVDLLDHDHSPPPPWSPTAMNRERQLSGVDSYARELRFNPVEVLTATLTHRRATGRDAAWLAMCCGTGRALIQAADQHAQLGRQKASS